MGARNSGNVECSSTSKGVLGRVRRRSNAGRMCIWNVTYGYLRHAHVNAHFPWQEEGEGKIVVVSSGLSSTRDNGNAGNPRSQNDP